MIITKIEKQKKDKNRYNIFLDKEFSFGLYEDSLLKFGLRTGDKINESKILEMKEFDEYGYGKKVAYAYLSYKQRSKKELIKKLKEKKISGDTIEKITLLLENQKYLDDNYYAKNFLESKINHKPIGKRLIKLKLLEKGIDKEVAENIIDENYSEEKEFEMAKKLLSIYSKKVRYKDKADKKSKCYRYLISKGFDYDIVRKILSLEE